MVVRVFSFAVVSCVFVSLACADVAKFGVLVLDDITGEPIPKVEVEGCFNMDYGWSAWTGSAGSNMAKTITDIHGRCRLRGKTNTGEACAGVPIAPAGYYPNPGGGGYDYKTKNLFGVWQPDNLVVTIRLQRVGRPIPLFVKQVGVPSPGNSARKNIFPGKGPGEKASYDMMAGDWLPPVGTGVVADIVFERLPRKVLGEMVIARGERRESFRESMSVAFPGPDNGLAEVPVTIGHSLRIRDVPNLSYGADYLSWYEYGKDCRGRRNYDVNRCFCFRIRTKRNEKDEIVQAYYGKIYGDIFFGIQEQPEVVFVASPSMRYYLNPKSLDRNLEWNEQNLCKDPGWLCSPEP